MDNNYKIRMLVFSQISRFIIKNFALFLLQNKKGKIFF